MEQRGKGDRRCKGDPVRSDGIQSLCPLPSVRAGVLFAELAWCGSRWNTAPSYAQVYPGVSRSVHTNTGQLSKQHTSFDPGGYTSSANSTQAQQTANTCASTCRDFQGPGAWSHGPAQRTKRQNDLSPQANRSLKSRPCGPGRPHEEATMTRAACVCHWQQSGQGGTSTGAEECRLAWILGRH